jgi:predicted ATP-grasp superfamily ATP-dependent carboligase
VVLKPTRSLTGPDGARRKAGVAYADSPAELRELIARSEADGDRVLVQSRICGPGVGIFLLRWQGEIVASFAHRRLREKPPSGGVSVRCESIVAPPELLAQAIVLLEALDRHGVAMVEFKLDATSGWYYLIEVYHRFWGSLLLAFDAGVDFPGDLVQLAGGFPVPHCHTWRAGRQSRWALGEVDHLIARLRHSRSSLHLPPGSESLPRLLVSLLLPWRPSLRGDVFRASDPIPAVREASAWLQELVGAT